MIYLDDKRLKQTQLHFTGWRSVSSAVLARRPTKTCDVPPSSSEPVNWNEPVQLFPDQLCLPSQFVDTVHRPAAVAFILDFL